MLRITSHTACDVILRSIKPHLFFFPFQLKNTEVLRYPEMILFIEEDGGRAASKVAKGRKMEKEADESEYRLGCYRRAAFQPGEILCNVSNRDYKYRAVKRENNEDSFTRLARDSIFRKTSLCIYRDLLSYTYVYVLSYISC